MSNTRKKFLPSFGIPKGVSYYDRIIKIKCNCGIGIVAFVNKSKEIFNTIYMYKCVNCNTPHAINMKNFEGYETYPNTPYNRSCVKHNQVEKLTKDAKKK